MKNIFILIFFFRITILFAQDTGEKAILVIHGGAGVMSRDKISAEKEKEYLTKLEEALKAGYDTLQKGGTSLAAVEKTIIVLENSPLFNAGKGSVLTNAGTIEMDASIMSGRDLKAGAVSGIRRIKNPIKAASLVMRESQHVMMQGKGAEDFAKIKGLELTDTSYFYAEPRLEQWKKQKQKQANDTSGYVLPKDYKYGTVGAIALDKEGNLAAGTSTGGMSMKKYGRIGDSPIIGAGTYADNNTCAISCTGHGEYFIRAVVAYDVSALMKYKNQSLKEAANYVINDKLIKMGAEGGLIGLDAKGNFTMPFNTAGMFRGYVTESGEIKVFIFK